MKIEFILQRSPQKKNHYEAIQNIFSLENIDRCLISSAFVTSSGVNAIAKSLLHNKSTLSFFAGVGNGITSFQALAALLAIGVEPYCVDTASNFIFHPKVYVAKNAESGLLLTGSANLTPGGLANNIEASLLTQLDMSMEDDIKVLVEVFSLFDYLVTNHPQNVYRVTSLKNIEDMLENGLLVNEEIRTGRSYLPNKKEDSKNPDMTPTMHLPMGMHIFAKRRSVRTGSNRETIMRLHLTNEQKQQYHPVKQPEKPKRVYTESSYHYPQGLHLGHVFYILHVIAGNLVGDSKVAPQYVRMRGGYNSGSLGRFQRQTKYKLQGMMEMGLIEDDRYSDTGLIANPVITQDGRFLYTIIKDTLNNRVLEFSSDSQESWSMKGNPRYFNSILWNRIKDSEDRKRAIIKIFIKMDAVKQMLYFIYTHVQQTVIEKDTVYGYFFQDPNVIAFCEANGFDPPSEEAVKHRLPFLLNVLESIGVVSQSVNSISIEMLLLTDDLVRFDDHESIELLFKRKEFILAGDVANLGPDLVKKLRERFGRSFLTSTYHIKRIEII